MAIVTTALGSKIGMVLPIPYWAAKLNTNDGGTRWLSEVDSRQLVVGDLKSPHIDKTQPNTFDWTMDLISTGDILKIRELWMLCPPNRISPKGNTATLFFRGDESEAGCAFHFNVTNMSPMGRVNHKVIGKVTDRSTGDCTCFIWDDVLKCMSAPFYTNVNDFASWRPPEPGKPGVAPIGKLSHEVIGLRGVSEGSLYHGRNEES